MPAVVDVELCDACKSCEEICPNGSIVVNGVYAVVKDDECIECNACVDACTTGALTIRN